MRTRLGPLVVCILFLASVTSSAGQVTFDYRRHTPGNAAVRSGLFPGWGQVFNGQPVKGYIGAGLFCLSVAGYLYYTGSADKDFRDYEQRGLRADSLYDDYQSDKSNASSALYAAVGIWFIAIVDAYAFGTPKADQRVSSPRAFEVAARPDGGVNLSWKRQF